MEGGGATSAGLLPCLCNDGVGFCWSHPKGQPGHQAAAVQQASGVPQGPELMLLSQVLTDEG